MVWFGVLPTLGVVMLPALTVLMVAAATGAGMWLTALAVQYRDVRLGVPMAVQLLMYVAPVAYPASLVPDRFRLVYSLNPMVGVIEGFRSALLDTNPMPWDLIGVGAIVAFVLLLSGAFYFRRMEQNFADVV
jgi:lipopolysaccharide transport system permease protein